MKLSNGLKTTIFKPTDLQLAWLKAALDPDVGYSLKAISEASGVSRDAWYNWQKKPDFLKWWHEEWTKGMERSGWYLDKIGVDKAKADYRYWEGMQMKFHKFAKKQDVTSGGEPISISLVNYADTDSAQLQGEELSDTVPSGSAEGDRGEE